MYKAKSDRNIKRNRQTYNHSTCLSYTDRSSTQKKTKDVEDFNILNKSDVTDLYRTLHPKPGNVHSFQTHKDHLQRLF